MGENCGSQLCRSGWEQGSIQGSGQERRGIRAQSGRRHEENSRVQSGRRYEESSRVRGDRRHEESSRVQSGSRYEESNRVQGGSRYEESSRIQSGRQVGSNAGYRRASRSDGAGYVQNCRQSELRRKRARAQEKRRRRKAIKRFALCAAVLALCMWMTETVKDILASGNLSTAWAQGSAGSSAASSSKNGNPESGEMPEILNELLEKNEETLDYVQSYPDREKYKSQSIDMTEDYVSGEVPLLMQWDKRWGYDAYGSEMIGLAGCGPLCLEMAYLYFTGNTDMTPRDMADFAYDNGFYTEQGTSWSIWTEGAARLGLDGGELSLDENVMKNALDEGRLIVCSMRPGDFTTTGHFILIRGYEEDGFLVNDPNRRSTSGRTWGFEELQYQIRNLWSLGKE